MGNELRYIVIALIELAIALFASKRGKAWIYVVIGANMILIGALGAKLTTLFGFVTNVGNVFYATIFFCLYLLVEHHGRQAATRGLWIGFIGTIFFTLMSALTLGLTSASATISIANAMEELFRLAPRVVLASVVAYFIAGYFNIWIYEKLKDYFGTSKLWLRNLASLAPAQIIDSVIFFTIAFYGTVDGAALVQIITGGVVVKVLLGILSTPFLYWSYPAPKQYWT